VRKDSKYLFRQGSLYASCAVHYWELTYEKRVFVKVDVEVEVVFVEAVAVWVTVDALQSISI
jgi:hypothetical protein